MRQVSKEFRRSLAMHLIGLAILCLLITFGYDWYMGNTLTDCVGQFAVRDDAAESLQYQIVSEGGMIEVQKLWVKDHKIYYTLKGTEPGDVYLVIRAGGAEADSTELFHVEKSGTITNVYTSNYSNCRFHLLMNVVFLTLLAGACSVDLLHYRKRMLYSFDSMFIGGLLIWLTCTVIIQWYSYLQFKYVYAYYENLQDSAYQFMLYTAPLVWAFCIALTVSNISLIRHEGYRPVNALGIVISGLLMLGSVIGYAADYAMDGDNVVQIRLLRIAISSYCSAYSLFACLLAGAVLGGISAARHVPPMDCDYIIILGCMIRKDGSLTPLLRGRVDRAIAHGKLQEKTTGKEVVYVPSGGQGRNEAMAEGEAMKRYLLSEGIPEKQILVEDKSTTTAENMLFSKKLIEERTPDAKIAFSTTNYHVFRSGIIATQKGFCPEGMGSKTKWYFWPNAFIREFIGMISYTKFSIAGILILLITVFAAIEMTIAR